MTLEKTSPVAPVHEIVPLPCPFCGAIGRCGPDSAYYFAHETNCWIYKQSGILLCCVSHDEIEWWNGRSIPLSEPVVTNP